MNKVKLQDLNSSFENETYTFIFGLGFDARSLSVLRNMPSSKANYIVGISNAGWNDFNNSTISEFKSILRDSDILVGENAKSIIDVTDSFIKIAIPIILKEPKIFLDITALSHELLVVVLGILNNFNLLGRCTLFYVGASGYSTNTDGDNIWLSRGVKTIRSVLGFPGTMLPSRRLHLIVLAGFEVERASEVILRYEPASLSIGLGGESDSISISHFANNQKFYSKLRDFVMEQDSSSLDVEQFYFSCISPIDTKNKLIAHIKSIDLKGEKNIVICPLNTKLSTVGVALTAIEYPEIQICYAEPDEYNIEGYCKPGEEVTIISL